MSWPVGGEPTVRHPLTSAVSSLLLMAYVITIHFLNLLLDGLVDYCCWDRSTLCDVFPLFMKLVHL
jgi:hypothetical protein